MEIKKRTEGKIKGCLSIRDIYKFYKINYPEGVDYKAFAKIIKESNKKLLDKIVNQSEQIQLPYRLGKLQVSKFERSFNQPPNKWKIDFKKSKELGFKVYFDQKYIYKWCWKKHKAIVTNKTLYKFEASRLAKRMVPLALKNNVDFFK